MMNYSSADTSLISYVPNAVSNNGVFEIPYKSLPIDFEFVRTTEADPTPIGVYKVNNRIKLVLYKPGYRMLEKEIIVDQSKGMTIDFVMEIE